MIHTFKKLFSFIITLLMVISLGTASKVTVFADDAVAKVGDTTYSTLVGALAAATTSDTVTLLTDVTLTADTNYDLTGKTVEMDGHSFVVSSGKLTMTGGTVKSSKVGTSAIGYDIFKVAVNASLAIQSGEYDTKSYQIIYTNGDVTINDGVFTESNDDTKIYDSYAMFVVEGSSAHLTMKAGSITTGKTSDQSCGLYGIYSMAGGSITAGKQDGTGPTITSQFATLGQNNTTSPSTVTVYGGTYTTLYNPMENGTLSKWHKFASAIYDSGDSNITISGGTFKGYYAISIPYYNTASNISISNGALTSTDTNFYIGTEKGDVGSGSKSISLTGGYYSTNPSSYVNGGYISENGVFPIGGTNYSYKVSEVKKDENKIESVAAGGYKNDTPDTTNAVTAYLTDTTIKVEGKVAADDTKVMLIYTTTDKKTPTVDINYTNNAFVQPADFKVGSTTYHIDITGLSKMPAEVAVVEAPTHATYDPSLDKTGDAFAKAIESATTDGLTAAATNEVKDTSGTTGVATDSGTVTAASTSTKVALVNNSVTVHENQKVVVVAQPYIDIKVADIATDEKTSAVTEITLEIEPKYNVVAVVVNQDATSVGTIDTTGSSGTKNAAVVAKEQTMKVTTPVVLSIPLPSTFKIDKDNFYVKHVHKNDDGSTTTNYYKATVTGTNPQIATFTTEGFSTYTFTSDTRVTTINFDDGSTKSYSLAGVNTDFPVVPKAGYTFRGWKIADDTTVYAESATALSDALLTKLNGKNVNATAVFTADAVDQTAPAAPELESATSDSITLKKIAAHDTAAAQYRINGGAWQDSNVFTGLSADTVYKFEARYAAVDGKYNASAASKTASFATKAEETEEADTYDVYRLYNPNSGEHFYTTSTEERDIIVEAGWNYEGVGWTSPSTSSTPIYRLYNSVGGEHHYTTSDEERDFLVDNGWNYEGITCYSDDAHTVAIYRQYNPNQFACNHNFTRTEEERDWLVDLGWKDEGTAWYAVN